MEGKIIIFIIAQSQSRLISCRRHELYEWVQIIWKVKVRCKLRQLCCRNTSNWLEALENLSKYENFLYESAVFRAHRGLMGSYAEVAGRSFAWRNSASISEKLKAKRSEWWQLLSNYGKSFSGDSKIISLSCLDIKRASQYLRNFNWLAILHFPLDNSLMLKSLHLVQFRISTEVVDYERLCWFSIRFISWRISDFTQHPY